MRADVVEQVTFLVAAFPYVQVPKPTQMVYARALDDMPIDVLQTAVAQCIAECEFFPTVAKIRQDEALQRSSSN